MTTTKINWEQIEPGWYTSEVGGIVKEKDDKWTLYSIDSEDFVGKWNTLKEAKKAVQLEVPEKEK